MASLAQLVANLANAKRSTGPRTPAGKAASAANSTRHGFRSQSVLIPGDDPAEYQALLDELTGHFGPNPSLTESRAIREMADAEWRLRRARSHQERMLSDAIASISADDPSLDSIALQIRAFEKLTAESAYFRQLTAYERKFERQYERAYRDWTSYQDLCRRGRARDLDLSMKEQLFAPPPRTNEANPAPETPRNAFCPCKSGLKYKRCCGKDAPAPAFQPATGLPFDTPSNAWR